MNKIKKNDDGFGVIEIILLLVVLVIIVGASYLVAKRISNENIKTASSTTTTAGSNKTNATNQPASSLKTFTDPGAKASFSYPNTWTLSGINGLCNAPNGCTDSTDSVNATELTSPDNEVNIIWSGIGGVGGSCDSTISVTSGGCPLYTVTSVTAIAKSSGYYVVEGVEEYQPLQSDTSSYSPFLAVQGSDGVLKTEQNIWYQSFNLPNTSNQVLLNMNNGYKDGGGGTTQNYSSFAQAQSFLATSDVATAKTILQSLALQ